MNGGGNMDHGRAFGADAIGREEVGAGVGISRDRPDPVLGIDPHNEAGTNPYQFEPLIPTIGTQTKAVRLIAAAAVAIVAAGIGIVAVHGKSSGSPSVQARVAASVNAALAAKTAAVKVSMDVRVGSRNITAIGTGVVDFTHGAMSVNVEMHAASQAVPITVLYLGGIIYERIPGLDQVEPGKSWITMDLSGITGSSAGALTGGGNPAAMLALLTQHGAVVTPTGSTTIGRTSVKSYRVAISDAMLQQELASSKLPSWMRAAVRGASLSGATETVYIDSANRLRRYGIDVTVQSGGQSVSVKDSVDLSNYGTPATISAPSANQTVGFEQFLKDAQAAQSSQG